MPDSSKSKKKADKVADPDSASEEEVQPAKKQKTNSSKAKPKDEVAESSSTAAIKKDKEGGQYLMIGDTRRVTVRQFKGKTLIDIREYYTNKDSGELAPGKKGISLNVEQWKELSRNVTQIDELVSAASD